MTDIEIQSEVQLTSNSPSTQHEFGGPDMGDEKESDGLQDTGQGEMEEPLSLLADVALAPPCGDPAACSCVAEGSLQCMQLQLQLLLSKADDLQHCLVSGQGHVEREALAAAVPSFIYTCQPYFNHLDSSTRITMSRSNPLAFDLCTRRGQLLDFSQQLCDRLEQLVLTYASYNLLSLDETEPDSVSHFCIGQSQLGRQRLSRFLYCKPTPYLAHVDTGLYKRMRWNVERLRDEQQQQERDEEEGGEGEEREAETVSDTEYYFLCYEDLRDNHEEAGGDNLCNVVRMWSIGQWVQVNPDPDTEDIYDWISCRVPQADYHRLLSLGSDEPSSCTASDLLQELLLSRQTTE